MNLESINKWLDEEYGCSYTRLEELHDFYFEKYTDHKKEINRLNNIIDKAIEYIENNSHYFSTDTGEVLFDIEENFVSDLLSILKGDNK